MKLIVQSILPELAAGGASMRFLARATSRNHNRQI
jgi:hypothetical protein